jgi:hypothetical protein
MWSDFPSFYFWFYEVIILENMYVIGQGKMQCVFLNIKLHL